MTGDGQYYIQFVRNGLQHGASSWHERRLLGPLIVRAMPLDAEVGFFVLTTVSLALTSLLTYAAAHALVGGTRALLAVPLLFGTWVVAPNLREFGLVDPVAWAFVAGVWLAMVRKRWWIAASIAAIGVVAKEVVVLAAVAAAAAAFTPGKPWRPAAVAAPAVLVAIGLTALFPGSGSDGIAYIVKWTRDGLFSNGIARAVFLLFASYGALWLVLPRAWARLPAHLQRAAVVFLLAALALPFVGSPERMEEAIFPLIIAGALLATRDWDIRLVWLLGLCADLFAARVGGDARLPSVLGWSGLAIGCALVLWSYAPRAFRRAPAPAPASGLPGTTAR
jgi:hypothetical protein